MPARAPALEPAASMRYIQEKKSGSNSVVECQLPKLDVVGSSPISRSKLFADLQMVITR